MFEYISRKPIFDILTKFSQSFLYRWENKSKQSGHGNKEQQKITTKVQIFQDQKLILC